MNDYQQWIPQLVALSHKAVEVIMEVYATDFKTETKADESPVTVADLAAEAVIEAGLPELARHFPLVAEEVLAAGCKMGSFPSGGHQGFNCAVQGCSIVNGS